MTSEFYLLNHSFRFPENITVADLENKIKDFSKNCELIRKYDSEKIFVHESIYEEIIFPDITTMELMYNPVHRQTFDRDTIEFLRKIVDKSEQTTLTSEEVKILLTEHTENQAFGLLCLHKTDFVEEQYLVYDTRNWLIFHRYFLGIYPKNSHFFFSECQKYFPALFFHQRNEETLQRIFPDFVKKIIYHLACLNDHFREIRDTNHFLPDALKTLSIFCKLDEYASLEGDAKRKKDLTFDFPNAKNEWEKVCCEPHLKLCRNDREQEYFYHRIYFHEGKENIAEGKILIGHIGEHL